MFKVLTIEEKNKIIKDICLYIQAYIEGTVDIEELLDFNNINSSWKIIIKNKNYNLVFCYYIKNRKLDQIYQEDIDEIIEKYKKDIFKIFFKTNNAETRTKSE